MSRRRRSPGVALLAMGALTLLLYSLAVMFPPKSVGVTPDADTLARFRNAEGQ